MNKLTNKVFSSLAQCRANRKKILIPGLFFLTCILFANTGRTTTDSVFSNISNVLQSTCWYLIAFLGAIVLFLLLGYPLDHLTIDQDIQKTSLRNKQGEFPYLKKYEILPDNKSIKIYYFETCGIPLNQWLDKQSELESALNINIDLIEYAQDNRTIKIKCKNAYGALPTKCVWDDSSLSSDESVIILGEGLVQTIGVDLNSQNSILIGGSTGSGKTVLLKLCIYQSISHGSIAYIADFKGGVDYSEPYWHDHATLINTLDDTKKVLLQIVNNEMAYRRALLVQSQRANIADYNETHENKIPRIIFACDEVAELCDKTGMNKDQKAEIDEIVALLSTIARLGRAFGIHLILAPQRPDANILPGQIKNNIDCRICGKADKTLSKIIIDTDDAYDKIPKTSRGRFISNDGTIFQAFWKDKY